MNGYVFVVSCIHEGRQKFVASLDSNGIKFTDCLEDAIKFDCADFADSFIHILKWNLIDMDEFLHYVVKAAPWR